MFKYSTHSLGLISIIKAHLAPLAVTSHLFALLQDSSGYLWASSYVIRPAPTLPLSPVAGSQLQPRCFLDSDLYGPSAFWSPSSGT